MTRQHGVRVADVRSGFGSAPRSGAVRDALREASTITGPLAIEITGSRQGRVYLSAGRITCVEAPGVPDVQGRLARSEPGGEDHRAATVHSVILDGLQALLAPAAPHSAAPAGIEVTLVRGLEAPDGSDHHLGVEAALQAADARAARCARLGIDPDLALELRQVTRPVLSLDESLWALVSRIDGRLTARDLAWAAGAELFATLEQVHRLVAAGLCRLKQATAPASRQFEPSRPLPGTGPRSVAAAATEPPTVPAAVGPQRRSGASPQGMAPIGLMLPPEWADDLTADITADADLIQRLIDGLRSLD